VEPGFSQPVSQHDSRMLVVFSESVMDKPLDETVWDNISGPFWDVKESRQIGFTQNYQSQFYLTPPAILPAAAQSGVHLVNSRLVVPFGRIFSKTVQSAAGQSFSTVQVVFDPAEVTVITNAHPVDLCMTVKIENFLVWENPLNHLNFYVKLHCEVFDSRNSKVNTCQFERNSLTNNLGGVFSTHANLIKQMNKSANKFAEDTVAELFQKCGL
jgi:hypothetical protein